MVVYFCNLCKTSTSIKSHYERHLLTKKHIMNEKVNIKSTPSQHKVNTESTQSQHEKGAAFVVLNNQYVCKFCDRQFSFKQSMYRHMKNSCDKKEDDYNKLVHLLNMQIAEEKEERKRENHALVKQIESLKGKLEIKGSFNNTINNITLNYNQTDVSHLTDQDYRSCIRKVCHSVLTLIEKIHFNPEKPENMNVYISNMRDKYAMCYEGDKWTLKNKTDTIDKLYTDKENMLEEWVNHKDEPEMRRFFDKYMTKMKESDTMHDINEQLKLMLYNKKELLKLDFIHTP